MSNTATFQSTSRFYLLAINGIVRKVGRNTEGATLIFARNLSAAKMQYLLSK
jgi:hypothetical protein